MSLLEGIIESRNNPLAAIEDIAAAVVYLAGPDAAGVTGHTLLVDGGVTAI